MSSSLDSHQPALGRLLWAANLPASVSISDASQGRGIFSVVLRVELAPPPVPDNPDSPGPHRSARSDREHHPRTVIAKLPGPNREAAIASGAFEREVIAYEQLTDRSPVRSPRCLAIERYDDGSAGFLLEDVGQYRHVDQVAGLGPDDALLAAQALARLHAYWESRPAEWPAIRRNTPSVFSPTALKAGLTAIEERWPSVDGDPLARLLESRQPLTERFASIPPTICHGDPRADNLAFGADEVVLFDWQQVAQQLGEADLGWLMATSLEPDVRRQCQDQVLALYAEAVGRSLDETTHRYRIGGLLPGLAVLLLAQRATPTERTKQFVRTSIERITDFVATNIID